jgi:hypothetical protein
MSKHGILVNAASSGSGGSWAHVGPVFLDKGQTLSLRAGGPPRLHPIGTGVAEGQIEYCSAPLTRTTNSSPSIVKPPDISLAASIALHPITSCRIDSQRYRSTTCSTFVTPLIVHIGAAAVLDFSRDNPD